MWTFVVTDRFGTELGELRQATGRQLRFPLLRVPTFTFTVRADHPMAPFLRQTDKTLVKAYEDYSDPGRNTLRFVGPVTSAERVRQQNDGTIACVASGAGWRLNYRLIGQYLPASNYSAGATFAAALAPRDRGDMVRAIITALNAGSQPDAAFVVAPGVAADTGIRMGAVVASASSYAGPWHNKSALEAISDLSAPLDGFDWEIAPVEPVADSLGVQIATLNIAPALGGLNLDAGWEFGTGRRNVDSFRELTDSSTLANRGINVPASWPDDITRLPIVVEDGGSIAERGLYESVVTGDYDVDDLRLKITQENVRIRRVPRRVVTFDPIVEDMPRPGEPARVPRLFSDFIVGDIMPFRAVEPTSVIAQDGRVVGAREDITIDALFRCYTAQVDIAEDGSSKTTLTFVEDDS